MVTNSKSSTQNTQAMNKISVKDIAIIGVMVAVIEACKFAFAAIPNVELTSFWIIIFTLMFKKRIFIVIPVFILIEGAVYGFGLWWIMYLYAWPLLAILTLVLKKNNSAWLWSVISGMFGLLFGLLCSIPYLFVGGPETAFAWWIAGIPWDVVHGVSNFVIMLVLYHPITKAMKKLHME